LDFDVEERLEADADPEADEVEEDVEKEGELIELTDKQLEEIGEHDYSVSHLTQYAESTGSRVPHHRNVVVFAPKTLARR
jgi:hypothetical protein